MKNKIQDYYLDAQGRFQGEYKDYYSSGQLMEHCCYKDNKKHGEYKWYNKDGSLWIHTYYETGINKGLKYLKILNLLEK